MLKLKNVDLSHSNIAYLGTKEHQKAKLDAANSSDEFKGAGQKPGVQIWRVEKFQLKRVAETQHGTFYSGDSYIVLNTYEKTPEAKTLAYNVHFWLGNSSSQDEKGVAAYKTVELDDLLGDVPVQFREVQGSESSDFLAVFGGTIRLLDGGVDSGFNSVKPQEYKPRLMHLKGKKEVRVAQVELSRASLNDGDVFILDNGLTIYQWAGSSAGMFEVRKATEICQGIKSERSGKPKVVVLSAKDDDEDFWNLLGGQGPVAAAIPDDVQLPAQTKRLFQLSDATGDMEMKEVASGAAISRSMLKTEDVFILDIGTKVFVWVGKETSKAEKSKALEYAELYLASQQRPSTTPILRLVQGGETDAFIKLMG